jgi:PST family polysaccharide transporter
MAGLSQFAKILLALASTVVVARFLSPSEYGVVAMASPITGFLLLFQNLGLSQAVVQREHVSQSQLSTLFWVNFLGSVAIGALLLGLAPVAGRFYGDPRAGQLIAASALTVLIAGLALQHSALLSRSLRFSAVGAIEIVSVCVNFGATVVLASQLRSFWAIWWGILAGTATSSLLLWVVSGWRPSLVFGWREARPLIGFGANVTGFNVLNFAARNLDNVLIARFWGAKELGLYDRAYRLMMFPLSNINLPLSRVIVPILSKLANEPDRYRRTFLSTLRVVSLLAIPGVAAATIASDEVVPLLLGERWRGAAPIFFWLGLSGVLQPITNTTGWLFLSRGRGREMVRWGAFISGITIVSVVVGLKWGGEGVAIAYFASDLLLRTPSSFWLSARTTPVRARDFVLVLVPFLVGGAATWAMAMKLRPHVGPLSLVISCLVFCYFVSFLLVCTSREGRETLRSAWLLVRRRAGARA